MILNLRPQRDTEMFHCIGESGARRLLLRGAQPARTATSSLNANEPGQRTVSFCLAHCPPMVSIFLECP
jgi:hypothetical protein